MNNDIKPITDNGRVTDFEVHQMKLSDILRQIVDDLDAGIECRWTSSPAWRGDLDNYESLLRAIGYGVEVRRKPGTITVNGIEVPAPIKKAPPKWTAIYTADPSLEDWYGHFLCEDCLSDMCIEIERNLAHLDAESAIKHAKAMAFIDWRKE